MHGVLEHVDLSQKLDRDEYDKQILEVQYKLVLLQQQMRTKGIPVCIMYEGWDASGKGGSILRITQKLDPRGIRVWPVGPPTDIEKQYHYLWRFWTRLPAKGEIGIFDRSWYGRVLVERVEKFATHDEWKRAYGEITDFERSLVANGTVLIKFWMQISQDEQLRRFKEREGDPFKEWKITPDDWRNRDKWDDYAKAAEDMFEKTDIPESPWHIIPAENKHFARVETAKIVAKRVEKALVAI
jgi:AMP-polyphosphate phosphotransferase